MADMSEDDLLEALHQRMVTTGAWDRLIDKMRSLLTATTYEDDLAAYAQGTRTLFSCRFWISTDFGTG